MSTGKNMGELLAILIVYGCVTLMGCVALVAHRCVEHDIDRIYLGGLYLMYVSFQMMTCWLMFVPVLLGVEIAVLGIGFKHRDSIERVVWI